MIRKNILTLLFLSFTLAAFSQMEIEEVSVTNIAALNTAEDEFTSVPYGEGIMFSSTDLNNKNKCDTCGYFQNMRYAMKKADTDCDFQAPVPVSAQIKTKKNNYGTPTFGSNGKRMILSQNHNRPSIDGRKRWTKLKLVTAELSDQNSWTNFKDLPFNMIDHETTHPSLSADGQTLYFASDRPGGIGGMDIWMVKKQGDDWGIPTNLGANINTAGNEIFPSINQDGSLSYSSNQAGGSGGLDIYTSKMENGAWAPGQNVGRPINSSGDDIGMVILADGESGYLTSNRGGGQGGDDIYCWKINTIPVDLAVEDAVSTDRLQGAKVTITGGKEDLNLDTDVDGMTKPMITFRRNYTINVEKEGYEPWSKEVTAKELAALNPYIVPLVAKAYSMKGDVQYVDSEGNKTRMAPGSKVILHNKTTGEKREVIADENGVFTFDNLHCFEDYELIAYNDNLESKRFDLPNTAIDCSGAKMATATLVLPEPIPEPVVCACNSIDMLALPVAETPKQISALGSRPEFGNSHNLDAAGFYNKLKKRYDVSPRDAAYLDKVFQSIGYSGFADASAYSFEETTIPNGMVGNMGYTKRHRIQYVQLNARNDRDLQAFRVSSPTGCTIHFMKTCGNLFFFCTN